MKVYKYMVLLIVCLTATSCLKSGLDELPAFTDADITGVYFEHRYTVTGPSGLPELKTVSLTGSGSPNKDGLTADMTVTVPASSGTFTESERNKVSSDNICVRINISNAASIEPVDGAPVLGKPGNFSSPVKYKVTAADGKTSKVWTLKIQVQK